MTLYKKIENYQIGFELAKGTYFARKQDNNYCVKLLRIEDDKTKEKSKMELLAMRKLNGHDNIIGLVDTFQFKDDKELFYGFASDLMPMNLKQYLDMKKENIKSVYLREICYQIANGLNFIHEKFIVHNDLKLENVMINPTTMNVRIIDFGLCNICSNQEEMSLITRIRGT
eukprot:TRINITY_DN4179_c0_g1_i2.p1 TRINITY_DN4179_c0_g1~~TRINITY_DN4179_c0_g1_i2.p1  ORF type:complete len:171 (-),score=31.40 TRINITY_DN4179_c0_g1_i2:411-923(-)